MHPAQHRGLRELYAMTRRLRDHWRTLAGRLEASSPAHAERLREGSDLARTLLAELSDVSARRGVFGRPLAQGLGARFATLHNGLVDPSLEVNQSLRLAVLDVVHVTTLLEFLSGVAAGDDDAELQAFLDGWASRMRAEEDGLRAAVVELAGEPDAAVLAATPGVAGKVGHGAATALGTFGEWFDRRSARGRA